MSLPTVGILTREFETVNRLAAHVEETHQLQRYEKLELLISYVVKDRPEMLILDFRIPSRGGHLEDRAVETLLNVLPDCQLAILTSEPCPETIERRIACHGLKRFKEPVDWKGLLEFVGCLSEPTPTSQVPCQTEIPRPEIPKKSVNGAIIEGLTRSFETHTPRMRQMLSELEIAAAHDVTILLIGETGSGKTFLSKLIHEISPRRSQPFLPVACGALPSELIESELFGHVKGAFTSAHADKDGKFLAAGCCVSSRRESLSRSVPIRRIDPRQDSSSPRTWSSNH